MKLKFFAFYIFLIATFILPFTQSIKGYSEFQNIRKKYDPRDDVQNYNSYKKDPAQVAEEEANKTKNETIYAPIKNVIVPELLGDLYWKGWVKYFHYDGYDDIDKPSTFFENPYYFKMKVEDKKYHKIDKDGHRLYIPKKNYFWAQLQSNDNFNILGSRPDSDGHLSKTIENLNTDTIGNILKEDNASGAVQDLGTFHEGNCIKVQVKSPDKAQKNPKYNPRTDNGEKMLWVFCTDTEEQKDLLMSYFIAIKLRRQEQIGDVLLEKKPEKADNISELLNNKANGPVIVKYKGRDASEDDGYWVLLQDWSECSVKCGGGTQEQQWICVPPRNKGKPCMGDNIRERKCNPQSCPEVTIQGPSIPQNPNHVNLAPIYKALPYSKRPQQYIKCFIKENDILYLTKEYDPELKKETKVPGRIVMNTQTISVFKDNAYSHSLFNFNLPDTEIAKSSRDHCCFFLISLNRQFQMCGFNNNCGTISNPIWVNQWLNDFEYFKNKCYRELKENSLKVPRNLNVLNGKNNPPGNNVPLTINDNGNLKQQLNAAQADVVNGKKQIIQKQIDDNVDKELDKKVGETQNVALTALRREINLEDLIKNEEVQKGKNENDELTQQVKQEKKKQKLLSVALEARENDFAKLRIKKDTKMQIDNVKKEAKVDIKFKRAVLKKKIDEIRKKYKRKNRLLQQQVQLIRSEMAEQILNANKYGQSERCKARRNDVVKIKEYCDHAFSEDFSKNKDCKDPQSFCYSCCEHEFGGMYINQRDNCQNMCDQLSEEELNNGDWVWSVGEPSLENKEIKPVTSQ